MCETPTAPTPTAPPDSDADVDWSRIHFAVPCPHCQHDLHGSNADACPACGTALDWAAVLPLETLRCLKCGYRLYGLTQPRCPECGDAVEWPKALAAARQKRVDLFEFQWGRRPLHSLWRTVRLSLFAPKRLWSEYETLTTPHIFPLLLLLAIQIPIFVHGWDVVGYVADVVMNALADWVGMRSGFVYRFRGSFLFFPGIFIWYASSFLALQLPFQTKKQLNINWKQILRVYVHASMFAALCPALWCVFEALFDSTLLFSNAANALPFNPYVMQGRILFVAAVIITWRQLWLGLARHLHMPHASLVAACSLLIGYMPCSQLAF